jgi:hypothetical protein
VSWPIGKNGYCDIPCHFCFFIAAVRYFLADFPVYLAALPKNRWFLLESHFWEPIVSLCIFLSEEEEKMKMAYDPNNMRDPNNPNMRDPIDPRLTTPELATPPQPRRSSTMVTLGALAVLILAGVFVWSQSGGPTTDPTTTSSTTPPAVTDQSPAPMTPMTPATPPANDAAPASPNNGTSTAP